jgi:negative regulator of flagellin synthesis FlgM
MSYSNGIGDWKQVLNPIATPSSAQTQQATERSKAIEGKAAARTESDETKLSPAAGLMAQALSGSDVRTDKVAALQKAIADGSYHVSSSDVAGKIIDSLLK